MIVRISTGFVNLANMTDCRIFPGVGSGEDSVTVYWNYTVEGEYGELGPARDSYHGPDAQAIIDALAALADAARRAAQ